MNWRYRDKNGMRWTMTNYSQRTMQKTDNLDQHLESTRSSYTGGRLPVSLFSVWLVDQMWMASWVNLEWWSGQLERIQVFSQSTEWLAVHACSARAELKSAVLTALLCSDKHGKVNVPSVQCRPLDSWHRGSCRQHLISGAQAHSSGRDSNSLKVWKGL